MCRVVACVVRVKLVIKDWRVACRDPEHRLNVAARGEAATAEDGPLPDHASQDVGHYGHGVNVSGGTARFTLTSGPPQRGAGKSKYHPPSTAIGCAGMPGLYWMFHA